MAYRNDQDAELHILLGVPNIAAEDARVAIWVSGQALPAAVALTSDNWQEVPAVAPFTGSGFYRITVPQWMIAGAVGLVQVACSGSSADGAATVIRDFNFAPPTTTKEQIAAEVVSELQFADMATGAEVAEVAAEVTRILGLAGSNAVTRMTRDEFNNLTAMTQTLYASKADAQAERDPIATFNVVVTQAAGVVSKMVSTKES